MTPTIPYPARFGCNAAQVGAVAFRAGDVHLDARRRAVNQADGSSRQREWFLRPVCGMIPSLAYIAADKIHAATGRRPDLALVDDISGTRGVLEQFAAGEKVLVANVER
jgi:hypothetical protein